MVLSDQNERRIAYVTERGNFTIRGVPSPGSYRLSVDSYVYSFPNVSVPRCFPFAAFLSLQSKIDVSADGEVKVYPMFLDVSWTGHKPSEEGELAYPIVLQPFEKRDFFVKRESFSVLSILSNPMIIMGLVSLGLVYYMPKAMENLGKDPGWWIPKRWRRKYLTRLRSRSAGGIEAVSSQCTQSAKHARLFIYPRQHAFWPQFAGSIK